jgi:GMP synthase (glutamine-hydrolysing)
MFSERPHLIIDCSLEEAGLAAGMQSLLDGAPARVVRAPSGDLDLDPRDYASVLVSGSQASVYDQRPWIEPLLELLLEAARADVPLLGICFGHQAIARAVCGPGAVRRAWRSELGWVEVEQGPHGALLDDLPPRFPCFVSHHDEVVCGLPELEVLARSERCPVHAFRVRGRRAFGVQFHPELWPSICAELVRSKLAAHDHLGTDPRPVLERAVDVRPAGRAIFARFLALARAPRLVPVTWTRHAV